MVATRGRTFKRPWRRSGLSSELKSSSAAIGRKDSWCFHAVGSSNAPLLGSTAAEGLPRIGRTSIATRWRSCGLLQSASCSENFVIPPDVFGQTLRDTTGTSVLKKESRTEVLKWLDDESETRGTQPKEWLAVFDDLLSGCQQQLQTNFTLEQLQDIGRLHNLRCDFVHFTPKGWSILKADLPRIIGTAL